LKLAAGTPPGVNGGAIYKNRGALAAALTMGMLAYVYFGALVGFARIDKSRKH